MPAASDAPVVSIVIPAFNKWSYTARCLATLADHTPAPAHEIIVVDNASSDETREALPRVPGVRVVRNEENLGFARASNQGAALARGRYLLFLNNDTEAFQPWLPPLVALAESHPSIAAVGAQLLFPDGTLQHAGVAFAYAAPFPISPFHAFYHRPPAEGPRAPVECTAVTGACLLVRAEVFREVGGFDEGYLNSNEDVDLCLKIRAAGHRIAYTPDTVLVHHESVSEGRFLRVKENVNRMHRLWLARFQDFDVDRRRTDRPVPPARQAPLSVVVPTWNALRDVAPCLEDLALNLGPEDELVVADAGSEDCTLLFVEGFAARRGVPLRVVRGAAGEGVAGLVRAVIAGVASARHPLVAVVKPELRAAPGWLDRAAARRKRTGVAALPGPNGGTAALGPKRVLARIAAEAPAAFHADDPARLAAACRGLGVRLEVVAPGAVSTPAAA